MDELKLALVTLDELCSMLIDKSDWETSKVAEKVKLRIQKFIEIEEHKAGAGVA
jgi:hypothetical protein